VENKLEYQFFGSCIHTSFPMPRYPLFTEWENIKRRNVTVIPIPGRILFNRFDKGIMKSMADPVKVRTPKITREPGNIRSVITVMKKPAPNTHNPLFRWLFPICQQKPDSRIKK
jgi:hypothetical protein